MPANQLPDPILQYCQKLSCITYENITKILHFSATGNKSLAQQQENALQQNLDHWLGGGTCFSLTWHLYQKLQEMGYTSQLLMGHKRHQRNVHCALLLRYNGLSWFFDPGYLIFDPLPIPLPRPIGPGWSFHPLRPNWVRLEHGSEGLGLWTGCGQEKPKLRFEFPLSGVSESEFHHHWVQSFSAEMMNYPVLNRLDRERGIQYYYQKGNLLIRSSEGSQMRAIAPENRIAELQNLFGLSAELLENARDFLT